MATVRFLGNLLVAVKRVKNQALQQVIGVLVVIVW